jgi:hypothetical protein
VQRSIRAVDHAVHTKDGDGDVLAFVLPETSSEGGSIFAAKLAGQIASLADEHGQRLAASDIVTAVATFPDDEPAVESIVERFRRITAAHFPEAGVSVAD